MAARLRELVPAALNVLERGLADANLAIAAKAAVEVLDRDRRFSRNSTINIEQRIPRAEIERAREMVRSFKTVQEDPEVETQTPPEINSRSPNQDDGAESVLR